ncbi:hypothetical protein T265_06546 [Opisthorchis viverrini]|uniref:Uncharacterized protein n=1 Tax=Opisthorchis viverrini TaxID=6198 RepID=A0A075ADL9_OPIVI|nr:hypothetical protein T265_06546 [Opisthorchis viverrini]KER26129.1 hypothetical protein T265_06546 [Opisthorchis viverrini]
MNGLSRHHDLCRGVTIIDIHLSTRIQLSNSERAPDQVPVNPRVLEHRVRVHRKITVPGSMNVGPPRQT